MPLRSNFNVLFQEYLTVKKDNNLFLSFFYNETLSEEEIQYIFHELSQINPDENSDKNSKLLVLQGALYETGQGYKADIDQAIRCYEKACILQNSEAMYRLALLLTANPLHKTQLKLLPSHRPWEKEPQLMDARSLFHMATFKLDHPLARVQFIRMFIHTPDPSESRIELTGIRAQLLQDFDQKYSPQTVDYAYESYQRAIELGCKEALSDTAYLLVFYSGKNIGGFHFLLSSHSKYLIYLLEYASSLGDANAMILLADLNRKDNKLGMQLGDDLLKASQLYDAAISLGYSDAMYKRAQLYLQGVGELNNEPNYAKAKQLLEQAKIYRGSHSPYFYTEKTFKEALVDLELQLIRHRVSTSSFFKHKESAQALLHEKYECNKLF